jgi:hypothetical protein
MNVIRGSNEAGAPLSAEICCISCCELFLKNMGRALCVWLEDETHTGLLVSDILREKALPVMAGLRSVSEGESST